MYNNNSIYCRLSKKRGSLETRRSQRGNKAIMKVKKAQFILPKYGSVKADPVFSPIKTTSDKHSSFAGLYFGGIDKLIPPLLLTVFGDGTERAILRIFTASGYVKEIRLRGSQGNISIYNSVGIADGIPSQQ